MNDQEQPKPEEQQPVTPPVTPPINDSHVKLEDLPPAARNVLDALVKAGYGGHKIKTELEKKFSPLGDILPAARGTYERYIDKHHERLEAEKQVEQQVVDGLKEEVSALNSFVNTAINGTPISKLQEIENLKRFTLGRVEFIEKAQASGIPSAQWESAMSSYINGYRTLLEKTMEYSADLKKEDTDVMSPYITDTFGEWLDNTIEVYQKIHGEFKLTEFTTELNSVLAEIVKAQLLERTTENDGPSQ